MEKTNVKLDPANHAWMRAPETRAVMDALGGNARFVGGAVRNALMGERGRRYRHRNAA